MPPSHILRVRLTPEQHAALVARAAREERAPSTMARLLIARGLAATASTNATEAAK